MPGSDPEINNDVEKIRERLADLRVRIAELRSGINAMIKEGEAQRDRSRKFLDERASSTKKPRR